MGFFQRCVNSLQIASISHILLEMKGIKSVFTSPINKLLKTTVKLFFSSLPDICVSVHVCILIDMRVVNEHLVRITDLSYKLV